MVSMLSAELSINLTCLAQGTIHANITFQFHLVEPSGFAIVFTKVCTDGGNTPATTEGGVSADVKQILYVVSGLVAGMVVLIIVIVIIYHWRVLAKILRRRSSQSDEE